MSTNPKRIVEALNVGIAFGTFIISSHCYDGRDVARFFTIDGLPQWATEAGKLYELRTSATTTKDAGIMVAKSVLAEKLGL